MYGSKVDVQNKLQVLIWKFRSSVNHKRILFPPTQPNPFHNNGVASGDEQQQQQQQQVDEDEDRQKLLGLWHILRDELDDYSRAFVAKRIYPRI